MNSFVLSDKIVLPNTAKRKISERTCSTVIKVQIRYVPVFHVKIFKEDKIDLLLETTLLSSLNYMTQADCRRVVNRHAVIATAICNARINTDACHILINHS